MKSIFLIILALFFAGCNSAGPTFDLEQPPTLIPGSGFTGDTPNPASIGERGARGYGDRAIARWDVVPYQSFSGDFDIGIIAFHLNGIARIDFSVNGGDWLSVSEMTLNQQTNAYEYTVRLRASDFVDHLVEVRAIVYPKSAGEARVLSGPILFGQGQSGSIAGNGEHSLFLFADSQNLFIPVTRYVSPLGSDDISLADGSINRPFKTITRAAQSIEDFQGGVDGALIYLFPGEYANLAGNYSYQTKRWLTISGAPGYDFQQIKITSRETPATSFSAKYIHIKDLSIELESSTEGGGYAMFQASTSYQVKAWFDHIWLSNFQSNLTGSSGLVGEVDTYYTNCEFNYTSGGPADAILVRGTNIKNTAGDIFSGAQLVVNSSVDNLIYIQPEHPDVYQTRPWVSQIMDNIILYNVKATRCQSHGLNLAHIQNSAFVNFIFQGDQSFESMLGSDMDHILIWQSTILGGLSWYADPSTISDLSIQNNILNGVWPLSADFRIQAQALMQSLAANNHFITPQNDNYLGGAFVFGTQVSTGEIDSENSPVMNRVTELLVPADLESNPLRLPAALGALQPQVGL